tara:strand:+ start:762 stop:1148 length:387 start_codon:yes stop_codon:yes gene_type:complete
VVNSRNKGASYERTTAQELFNQLGIKFKRDLEQYRTGGYADLIPDNSNFPYTLELKRYKDGAIGGAPAWWAQVEVAAEREGKWPCLIYKYDRRPDRVVIPLASIMKGAEGKIETDLETFCYIVRELMS